MSTLLLSSFGWTGWAAGAAVGGEEIGTIAAAIGSNLKATGDPW